MPAHDRVVAHRRMEPEDSLDFFPTGPWATRALFRHVLPRTAKAGLRDLIADEPACGEGHMTYVLQDFFGTVRGSDIHDYGRGFEVRDFLAPGPWRLGEPAPHWIITNPPFGKMTVRFMLAALRAATQGVATFVRTQYVEGVERYWSVYLPHPPTIVAHFVERVPLHKGRWLPDGDTLTAYSWIVWRTDRPTRRTDTIWIPPCRKALLFQRDIDLFGASA